MCQRQPRVRLHVPSRRWTRLLHTDRPSRPPGSRCQKVMREGKYRPCPATTQKALPNLQRWPVRAACSERNVARLGQGRRISNATVSGSCMGSVLLGVEVAVGDRKSVVEGKSVD